MADDLNINNEDNIEEVNENNQDIIEDNSDEYVETSSSDLGFETTAEAAGEEIPEKSFNLGKEVFEWFYTIVIALLIAFIIKGFLFDMVKVDGQSMENTLYDGDRLIVQKIGYSPKQGDIIILDSTYEKRSQYYENLAATTGKTYSPIGKFFNGFTLDRSLKTKYYVKRIIALPGQTVDIKDGNTYVDGEIIDDSYCKDKTYPKDVFISYPLTVKEGYVFVMGDNRENSTDSRFSSLGQVPYKAIMGKAVFRLFPFNSIGPV